MITSYLPECSVVLSTPVIRTDSVQAHSVNMNVIKHLSQIILNVINNNNISNEYLGKRGLHLNVRGVKSLALNIISKVRNF